MNLHFVRSIRGLQNFLAIPIMNTLAGFMIYIYIYISYIADTNALTNENKEDYKQSKGFSSYYITSE